MNHLCFMSGMTSAEWASWVQALLSIGTIIAGFVAVNMQIRQTAKERRRSILAIAEAANEHGRRIGEAFDHREISLALYQVYDKTIIDSMVQALSGVQAAEIGSSDGVIALYRLRDQFVFLGSAVYAWQHPGADIDTAAMPPTLGDPHVQSTYLKQRKTILAQNIRDRIATIRQEYLALKKAMKFA